MRAMRDSGVDWLGAIPAEWRVLPVKAVFRTSNSRASSEDQHLTPSQKFGVLSQIDYMKISGTRVVLQSTDSGNMKLVMPGDFISHLRSFQGGLELSTLRGKVSGAYTVLRPVQKMESRYFKWALKCDLYVQGLQTTTDQLRDGQTIRMEQLQVLPLPFPDLDEQRDIAKYLDQETSQIDLLISKKEQLIEKLLERRQALITQAVTKGLDSSVPMKDSGVDWIGAIPSNWDKGRLQRFATFGSGSGFPEDQQGQLENEFPFLKVDDLGKNHQQEILTWQHTVSKSTAARLGARVFPKGTLVMAKIGAALLLGRVKKLSTPSCIDNNMIAITAGQKLDVLYLAFYLASLDFAFFVNPGTVPSTSGSAIASNQIPLPELKEQEQISAFIQEETSQIDLLVEKTRMAIHLLKERRQALITQVVTGKLDVRGFAGGNS